MRVATEHNVDVVKLLTAYGKRVLPQGAEFTSIQVSVAGGGTASDALYPVHHDSNNMGTRRGGQRWTTRVTGYAPLAVVH